MMTSEQSQEQMVDSMSKMMDDPTMRKQMRSLMAGAMSDMSGMAGMDGKKSAHGNSGMNQMHQMTHGSK